MSSWAPSSPSRSCPISASSSRKAASISTRRGAPCRGRAASCRGARVSASTGARLAVALEAGGLVDEVAASETGAERYGDVNRRRHRGETRGDAGIDLGLRDEEEVAPDIAAHVGVHLELVARAAAR